MRGIGILGACLFVLSSCQVSGADSKLDQLLVVGDRFSFGVKEPEGWQGDTENAQKFQANVILYEKGKTPESTRALIRVRGNPKADEDISHDMAADMQGYRTQYPKVQFKDLKLKHSDYLCLAKLFYVSGEFYEYVAYLNPGKKKPVLISASMNIKTEATVKEMDAYRAVVQSLVLLNP